MFESRRLRRIGGLLCACLVAGTACGSGSGDSSPDRTAPSTVPAIEVIGDADAVKVGVLAIRSAVAANSQYGPVVEYLEDELGRSFELVPLGQDDIFDAVATGEIDFVMSNPLSSVQISRLYGTEFIGTLDRDSTGPEFGGIIIVRDDSDIIDLADLRGRDVTCVAFQTAAAGCNFQVLHLLEAGVAPDDFGSFTETPSQDNIVLAVLNGDVDAGFVRTGQLERMVADGILLDTSELRILDQQASDYVFPHTTRLYPEWPFAALAATDDELVEAVSAALLGLDADSEAAEALGAVGFVEPLDYGPLSDLVVELQLRSWDAPDS